ncbi:MAG: DUF1592 domain-containing protein [Planctomycetes bacterium]|nr:DUF1592 domain-containing protein [Planctomycetota bacterium]
MIASSVTASAATSRTASSATAGVLITRFTQREPVDGLAADLDQRYRADVRPLMQKFCIGCHEGNDPPGDLALDRAGDASPFIRGDFNLHLLRDMISTGEMPPKKKPQPSEHERLIMTQWLDAALAYVPLDAPVDPGWCTPHRLNRTEYRNTLRDLLHLQPKQLDFCDRLLRDDTGYGFDNVADVLTTSPLAVEQYLAAAEAAIERALGPIVEFGDHPSMLKPLRGGNGQPLPRGGFYLYSNGGAGNEHAAPYTGEYLIRVKAWETKGGDEAARLSLRVDGKEVAAWSISGTREKPQEESVRVRLKAGNRKIAANFTNDFYEPQKADRNLGVESISIAGPLDEATTEFPKSRSELLASGQGITDELERVERVVGDFASRAYRRPVEPAQLESLMKVYRNERGLGADEHRSLRTTLTAVLVSPSFLFRTVEIGQSGPRHTLDAYELASRLSYFLWSSTPDGALLSAAAEGSLTTDEGLRTHVQRMLKDAKADAFVENFTGQWLQLRTLETLNIDTGKFPQFSSELRSDMIREAREAFRTVLVEGRSVLELIASREITINERLAAHYGIDGVHGSEFRKVTLPDSSPRGGILTTGAVLTLTSNTTRTSPVKRGLFVLDQILGAPPPPPPADIPPLDQSAHAKPDATVREQLAIHTANASCAACHNRLDPLGLTFEKFDAVGTYRDQQQGKPIDSSGTLPGGVVLSGSDDLKENLLARSDQFVQALTSKLMTYAFGRGVEPFDRPAIRKIAIACRERGDRLDALIEAIVLSESFRTCRPRVILPADPVESPDQGGE